MSKGFLIYAQNTDAVDYVEQAYILALSIKYSQYDINSVSLVTNDTVPKKWTHVFDQVIKIPWTENTTVSRYCAENRWKLYHVTPYDETIVLDSDMLILEDISYWWSYCENYDIKFCSKIKNYKLEPIVDKVYRKAFISNNLYSPYFALHYFKKCEFSHNFYKVLEFVCNNWEWCWSQFASTEYQNWVSMDLATAVAIEIVGNQEYIIDANDPLEFVHMKVGIQGWQSIPDKWQDACSYVLNSKGELIINNIKQSKLFHYVDPEFLTINLKKQLENLVYGKEEE